MKRILSALVFVAVLASCQSKSGKRKTNQLSAKPVTVAMIPVIIIKEENGILKAYRGVRDSTCGNPMYNPSDTITLKNFNLVVDVSKTLILSK